MTLVFVKFCLLIAVLLLVSFATTSSLWRATSSYETNTGTNNEDSAKSLGTQGFSIPTDVLFSMNMHNTLLNLKG